MPSASQLYTFPVPLGRRGAAALAVFVVHVVVVAALVAGLAVHATLTIPIEPPRIQVPRPQLEPDRAQHDRSPATWTFTVPQPDAALPEIVKLMPAPESPVETGVEPGGSAPDAVVPSVTPARVLQQEEPLYPAASRRLGEQGVVVLRVRVLPDGTPATVEVATSSGHRRLDDAAVAAVRHWRFAPAQAGAGPVASWVNFKVTFRLTD